MSHSTSWDPDSYAKNARFVSDLGEPLLRLLDPKPGELIMDLGCGDGALTEKIAASGCAVYGVDASPAQIRAAKQRGLQTLVMDGHRQCFKQRFNAVFSNAALHWMKQPERVVSELWNSLKPGGRFVGELGGEGNVAKIRFALHSALRKRAIDPAPIDPWYFPSAEEYSRMLAQTGFTVRYIDLFPRPTRLPGDILGWLEVFAQPFTGLVDESNRPSLFKEVRAELEPALRDPEGNWFADYVRLRFYATK